jgi:hypothetical protein
MSTEACAFLDRCGQLTLFRIAGKAARAPARHVSIASSSFWSDNMPRCVAPQTMKMGRAPARGTGRGIYAASPGYLDWPKTRAARGEGRTLMRHECRAPA